MRALLLTAILVTIGLAGCASDPADIVDELPPNTTAWMPGAGSHPAYGFPTADDLPEMFDNVTGLPADWHKPLAKDLPDIISSIQHDGQMTDVVSGAGIAVFGHYAYAGSYDNAQFYIIDISDPMNAFVAGEVEAVAGDTDIIAYPPTAENPDGRLVAVTSTRGGDMIVIDVTVPANASIIATIPTTQGNHNHQVVPGTPIVYNAPSDGSEHADPVSANTQAATGSNDIWDLSDPFNPVHVRDFENGYGCHAISFYVNATEGKFRGYCAGIEMTQIWDITNVTDPSVISTFPFPTGGVDPAFGSIAIAPATFSHLAMPNHDGTVLIVGDETGGGAGPGCDIHVEAPTGQTLSGPLGNLWFYDISGDKELDPVLHGSYSPSANDSRGGCTAHFGDLIGDQPLLLMAFYTAGVALIDFSDLDNPKEVDLWQPGEGTDVCVLCGVWDVQYYQGRAYTGDITRGMDFLSFA